MSTTVINIKDAKTEKDTVYIGRPSKWGNPFVIGVDGTRSQVVAKYKSYVTKNENLMSSLEELRNKKLVCYCKPKLCHGDVLVELLNLPNPLFPKLR